MTADTTEAPEPATKRPSRPLYPRLLRLRHIAPNTWQRAVLGEGALAIAVLLVLADLASAWTLLVLPLAVAGVVKAHDVLAGLLPTQSPVGDEQYLPDPEVWYEDAAYADGTYEESAWDDAADEVAPTQDGYYLVTDPDVAQLEETYEEGPEEDYATS